MLKKQLDEKWNRGYCLNPNALAQWTYSYSYIINSAVIVKCLNNIWKSWKSANKNG